MDISKITVPVAVSVTCLVTVVTGVVWGMDRFPPRTAVEKLQEDVTKIKEDLAFLRGFVQSKNGGK